MEESPALPPAIAARILSYNVSTYKDVAELGWLRLKPYIPSLAAMYSTSVSRESSSSATETSNALAATSSATSSSNATATTIRGHHIRAPLKRSGKECYPMDIINADLEYFGGEEFVTFGEEWIIPNGRRGGDGALFRVFDEGVHIDEVRFLDISVTSWWVAQQQEPAKKRKISKSPKAKLEGDGLVEEFRRIVGGMESFKSTKELHELYNDAKHHGLFDPVSSDGEEDQDEEEDEEEEDDAEVSSEPNGDEEDQDEEDQDDGDEEDEGDEEDQDEEDEEEEDDEEVSSAPDGDEGDQDDGDEGDQDEEDDGDQDEEQDEEEEDDEEKETVGPFSVLLTMRIPKDSECIVGTVDDNDDILLLQTKGIKPKTGENVLYAVEGKKKQVYRALVAKMADSKERKEEKTSEDDEEMENEDGEKNDGDGEDDNKADAKSMHTVQVLIKLIWYDKELFDEMEWDELVDQRPVVFDEVVEKYSNHTVVEGVATVDGFISDALKASVKRSIDDLSKSQVENNRVDYHPNSGDIVRDLVHPALYPFVDGVTTLKGDPKNTPAATLPSPEIKYTDGRRNRRGEGEGEWEYDFWGRPYEKSAYQWMPTYFRVSEGGECSIDGYINNLVPRDDYADLYEGLSRLFQEALPYVESVYSYVHAVRSHLREQENDVDFLNDDILPLHPEYVSLRGQDLQVITKIVDYELGPGQSHEGVYHVEGMSHEEIVLTCLYVLDRDEAIEGGDLEFKRALLRDEASAIRATVSQERHPRLDEIIQREGMVPLGRVQTRGGRLVVFPNSHVHKVGTMKNIRDAVSGTDNGDDDKAKRRIVVFFLVNPLKRIVSTREVDPQQEYAGGNMTLDDALAHRLKLMEERKYHKQDWNVREVELCEH